MATHTFGTNLTSSLTAVTFLPGYGSGLSAADIAAIALSIKDDIGNAHGIVPAAFSSDGLVYLPQNRGVIRCLPGDIVAVDNLGWPLVVSARSKASGNWTFV